MKSHKERVLHHLKTKGSITSWEAFEIYGITRLSAVIYDLKKDGHRITSTSQKLKNRYGNTVVFSRYKLQEKENDK